MATQSFIRPAGALNIQKLSLRAFATRKSLGETFDVVLYRDENNDGEEIAQAPQNVLVVMAKREANPVRGEVSAYMGADGELQKEVFDIVDGELVPVPFNVKKDDAFRMPNGTAGVVTVVLPEQNGVVRAAFTLRG